MSITEVLSAIKFQQHALEQSHHNEPEIYIETSSKDNNNNLTFSQAVGIVTDILYEREHQGLPPIWIFEEFRAVMELEDKRLKYFFDELYLSINPLKKSKSTMENVSKQLVFLCYFICGIRNKFVNNAKRDLGMYLDSTGTPDSTIDTLATLGMTITSRSIAYHKDAISKKHLTTVESNLADTQLIKIGIENNFMSTYSLSHNQHWGFHLVSDKTKLEELTVHSYDVRLKEKRNTRSLKDAVLVDLLESKLQSMEAYINAINVAASVPTINRYIEDGNVSMKRPLKRSKKEGSANTGNSIPIPAMKMKEAWLCHLPLGYSSSHKPSLYGCDSSNCFITKTIITEETGQPEIYTETSRSANVKNSIPIPAMKIITEETAILHQINLNSNAEGEGPDSILEGGNDDIKEFADGILVP
ncbi:11932_t:CDS:2 [Entrophospora sp. SA101]|nr:11932_t:CDS:2 [Entrophospora sp. SA101]